MPGAVCRPLPKAVNCWPTSGRILAMKQTAPSTLVAFVAALLPASTALLRAADPPAYPRAADSVVRVLPIAGNDVGIACAIYAPQLVVQGKAGLVVHLYGSGGSHKGYNIGRAPYDELRRLLAAQGYWLVVPELGPRHWMNDAACGQLDAVIAELVQRERVDPARVHLLGTSMGAGSSLIYVMRRPGTIKSVAAIFPMTDFAKWLQEKPGYRAAVEQAHGILSEQRDAALQQISPLGHPEAFRNTPVFLLHGDRDATVLLHHSRDFAAALKDKGCSVIYREVAGGTHNDSIVLSYQKELADFLTKEDE
jgi:dipeptidyl aminopeptidase/acylaminoacyl peptidase